MTFPKATPAIPGRMIAALRSGIADEIAKTKSYDVPGLCTRLGLAPGTGDEAHQSTARYASRRLAEVGPVKLVEIARTLLEEAENFDLEELVGKIDDLSAPEVTEITRRMSLVPLSQRSDLLGWSEVSWRSVLLRPET